MYFPFGVAGFSSPDPRTGGWCWCPRVFGLGAGTGGVSGVVAARKVVVVVMDGGSVGKVTDDPVEPG